MRLPSTAFALLALTASLSGFANQNAHAVPINGSLGFNGSGSGSQAGGISTLTFNNSGTVDIRIGDYVGIPSGTPVNFAPISWSGSGTSAVLTSSNSPQWTVTSGGVTYQFSLLSLVNATINPATGTVSLSGRGTATISGAINRDPTSANFSVAGTGTNLTFNIVQSSSTASGMIVSSAASRKIHAGTAYDVDLPLTGPTGIEPRLGGGTTNDYTMLSVFAGNVTVTGNPQAQVIAGTGLVGNGGLSNGGAVIVNANTVTIPLTNVASQQTIQVRLNGVNGTTNVTIPMSILVGDANADAVVNSGDTTVTRARSGQSVDPTNFRTDYNQDGAINAGDTTIVRARSGQFVP